MTDYRKKAKAAFEALQNDGPVDVPRWDDLHQVERDHLTRFAEELLRNHASEVARSGGLL